MKEYMTEPHGAQSLTMIDQADTFGNSIFAVSDKYAHIICGDDDFPVRSHRVYAGK